MNVTLYNIGIWFYSVGIYIASPFNNKASLWLKGRRGIRKRLREIERGGGRLVWFHASSLGEFEQGRPIMEDLRAREPETKILLTFFSPSGFEIRKKYAGADYIYYLPLDSVSNANLFLDTFRPDVALFIKYEYWYHYLTQLHKREIPTYLVSAIFRKEQSFFRKRGNFYRSMLHCFSELFVQDDQSLELLNSIGIYNVVKAGDTRFDRVVEIAEKGVEIDKVSRFTAGRQTVICGSTWPKDEEIILDYINKQDSGVLWIIVPHEIGEEHINTIITGCHKPIVRYSEEVESYDGVEVLVVDAIGVLSSIYRYGIIAYIGGGFGQGIHNTLEAAVYGIPILFGPNHKKFREALQLIDCGGAFPIAGGEEFASIMDSLINHPAITKTAGEEALKYVKANTGATKQILKYLT